MSWPQRRRMVGVTPQVQEAAPELSYHAAIDAYRRELIHRALAQAQGNRAAAAKILGLQRTHVQRLLGALHIDD